MKKYLLGIILTALSNISFAQAEYLCGEIKRLRVWVTGNDTYGIWAEYQSNPSQCSNGFFFPHNADNKQFAYSLMLAAKASGQSVCIQTYPESEGWKIGNRCKINYVGHQ